MWALVVKNAIVEVVQHLPTAATSLATGAWVVPENGVWTASKLKEVGYVSVVESERPADTETQTTDNVIRLTNGVPSMSWIVRDKTSEELAVHQAAVQKQDWTAAAAAAAQRNTSAISSANVIINDCTTYLNLAAPTAADAVAQVKDLCTFVKGIAEYLQDIANQLNVVESLVLADLSGDQD